VEVVLAVQLHQHQGAVRLVRILCSAPSSQLGAAVAAEEQAVTVL